MDDDVSKWLEYDFMKGISHAEDPMAHLEECIASIHKCIDAGGSSVEAQRKLVEGEELLQKLRKSQRRAVTYANTHPGDESAAMAAFEKMSKALDALDKASDDSAK